MSILLKYKKRYQLLRHSPTFFLFKEDLFFFYKEKRIKVMRMSLRNTDEQNRRILYTLYNTFFIYYRGKVKKKMRSEE